MRVLLFGTYDTRLHPRIKTIAEGLRDRGADVAECNAPLGLDTAARVKLLTQPWRLPALAARLANRWAELALKSRRSPWRCRPLLSPPTTRLRSKRVLRNCRRPTKSS